MIFQDLSSRGLIKQITHPEKIQDLIDHHQIEFYIGFDPTADSLHVGHLLQLITAERLARAGHTPILLIGGATASIGDPSGKSEMRKMLSFSDIRINSEAFLRQFSHIVKSPVKLSNNLEWFDNQNFLFFLREITPHFSVNQMLRAECFKNRMEQGLSFLEFNYMLMQAYDFLRLHQLSNKCLLQIGGDDQWSNILAGIDLIHKKLSKQVFGLTLPLLTTSTGQKMGKTEKGAIWLDKKKTSVFDFFQFWRNILDEDVIKCFKLLTFLSLEEINSIPFSSIEEINSAKKKLALELTKIVHSQLEAEEAFQQAEALFENKNSSLLVPIEINDNLSVLEVIVKCNFAKSKTEARNLIANKGIIIDNEVIIDPTLCIDSSKFGTEITLKKGKKNFCRLFIKRKENICSDPIL